MRVFITGGTGLVGKHLIEQLLLRQDQPVVLTRKPEKSKKKLDPRVELVKGTPQIEGDWFKAVDGCDAVINLAGENLFARRWSERQKQEIRESRVYATSNVVKAIEVAKQRPAALVNASAIGIYGNVPEGDVDENTPPANDYVAGVCKDWEAAAREAEKLGTRVVILRLGVVLDKREGALKQMLLPFKLGFGSALGSGKQWMSWIHIDDLVNLFIKGIEVPAMRGVYNATAPEPVRNLAFSKALAKSLHRPFFMPAVPAAVVKLMFGEVSQLVLEGQRVLPKAAKQLGFQFQYRTISEAFDAILRSRPAPPTPATNAPSRSPSLAGSK